MTRWKWFWVRLGAAIAAAILIYIVHGYGSRYCFAMKAANYAREAKDKVAPIDCLEFWLNRYQSMLAGLLAAGVALIVARPVFRALRETNRQTSVAIRGIEEAYARELELEFAQLASYRQMESELYGYVEAYDEVLAEAQLYATTYSNNFNAKLQEVAAYLRDIAALFARYPDGSPLSVRRKEFLRAANASKAACDRVLTAFRNETFGPAVEHGEPEMDAAQIRAARVAAPKAHERALENYKRLTGLLRSETRTQWARVRQLQRMARGEA